MTQLDKSCDMLWEDKVFFAELLIFFLIFFKIFSKLSKMKEIFASKYFDYF